MIYLLYSSEPSYRVKQIGKIVKDSIGIADDFNCIKIDASESSIEEIVFEVNSNSLTLDKKIVIASDCIFLDKDAKVKGQYNTDLLIDYINNQHDVNDLIISVNCNNVDTKSKIYTLIEKCGEIHTLTANLTGKDWEKAVHILVKKRGSEISNDALIELASRTTNDVSRGINEIDKLTLYSKNIKIEDVKILVKKPLEENVFQLTNALLKRDNKQALIIFNDLRVANVEPITLISLIGNAFRFVYQAKFLSKIGMSSTQIANELKTKNTRVDITLRNSGKFSLNDLSSIFEKLYKLDLQIKSGLVDRFVAFELFIINF